MKKKFNILYIAVFMLICCLPMVFRPFSGGAKQIGNEKESEFPKLFTENGLNGDFSKEADAWFSKQNPFRIPLINCENTLKLNLLQSDSGGVIQGKDGWLFSEETLDDYLGVTMTKRGAYRVARTVRLTQDAAERCGSEFVFTVIPNKNTLYAQYMPNRFIKGETSNMALVGDYLNAMNVSWLDMKQTLSSHNETLYLRDDTHWNNLGALYGCAALVSYLGKAHDGLNGMQYAYRSDRTGDLVKMAFPESGRTCGQYYFDYPHDSLSFIQPRGADVKSMLDELAGDSEKRDGLIRTDNPSADGSLFMVRDSFGRAMLSYLTGNYQSAVFTRYYPFTVEPGHDDFIWEIVERNIPSLTETAPRAFAARCSAALPSAVCDSANNLVMLDDSANGSLRLYGALDEKMLSDESNVYVILKSGETELCYEAFPIYEKSLETTPAGDRSAKDNGFSVTLSTEDISRGDYEIYAASDGTTAARTQLLKTITIGD